MLLLIIKIKNCLLCRNVAQRCSDRENMPREIELTWRIAKELSDIIVYCRAVTFNQERILRDGRNPHEMSSLPEQKAEKLMLQEHKFFLWYHQVGRLDKVDIHLKSTLLYVTCRLCLAVFTLKDNESIQVIIVRFLFGTLVAKWLH